MKSLNFNKLNIQKEDVLGKAQMKQILGGHSGGVDCASSGMPCGPDGATCMDETVLFQNGSDQGCCCTDDDYNADCDA